MNATIKVHCVRPMMFAGQPVAAGALLTLTPLAASDAIASGRAVLANPADAERVNAAATAERDRMLRNFDAADRGYHGAGRIGEWRRRA